KKRSRPIQYLLSADRKLRRLSLRRIVARGRKAPKNHQKNPQPTGSHKGRPKKATPSPTIASTATIVLAVSGIIATGGFLAARQRPRDAVVAEPQVTQAQLLTIPAPAVSDAKKILPSRATTAVAAIKTNPPAPTVVVKPLPEPAVPR